MFCLSVGAFSVLYNSQVKTSERFSFFCPFWGGASFCDFLKVKAETGPGAALLPWAKALSPATVTLTALPGLKSNLTHFTWDFLWLTRELPRVTSRISIKNPPFRCGSTYILSLNWCINIFPFIDLSLLFLNKMTFYLKIFFSDSLQYRTFGL